MKTIPSQLLVMKTEEEVKLTLHCAKTIKKHLNRLIKKEGLLKYESYLTAVDAQLAPLTTKN